MINIDNKVLIKKLKEILDDNCYDLINEQLSGDYKYFFNPIPDYASINLKLSKLNLENKELFSLLLLGNKVSVEKIINSVGKEFIDVLVQLGIAYEEDGYIKTNNYIIVSYMGKYFLVNTPIRNPNCKKKNGDIYIGMDSYRLVNNIETKKTNNVLDLCTGSGIQGIFASAYTDKVVEIELNEIAANAAKFNIILNDLESKIDVRNNALYESVKGEKFDIIYSNPPFVPVPKQLDFPICGRGGEDGLDIVKEIISGYKEHLNEDGCAVMIGEAIGDDKEPFLRNVVKDILGEGYESQLIITTKNTATCQISRTLDLAIGICDMKCNRKAIYDKWYDTYKRMGVTHYYAFYLKVKKKQGGDGKVKLIDLTHSWNTDSIPKLSEELNVLKLNTIYGVTRNGRVISSINQNTYDILKLVDNKRNIEEIYEYLLEKGNNICMRNREEVIDDIINLCNIMEYSGVISK